MLEDYANIFNKRKLFLRFNGLQKAFFEKLKNIKIEGKIAEKWHLFDYYFTEYKYYLYSAYYFLEQLEQLETAIMKQYTELKTFIEFQNEIKIEYDSFIVQEYLLRIMPFLNTMFLLQDRLMVLITIFLDVNFKDPVQKNNELDKDYKDRIKKFRHKLRSFASYATNYYGIRKMLPDKVSDHIIKYWEQNGQELRKYRNLVQHQFNLIEEAYIIRKPSEQFILYLPDNPNEESFKRLTYNKKRIAFNYFKSEIQIFHNFVETIMDILGIDPAINEFSSKFSSKSNLISNYNQGDLLKIWVLKNEAILFSVGEKVPDGNAAKINIRKIKNKMNILRWEIK